MTSSIRKRPDNILGNVETSSKYRKYFTISIPSYIYAFSSGRLDEDGRARAGHGSSTAFITNTKYPLLNALQTRYLSGKLARDNFPVSNLRVVLDAVLGPSPYRVATKTSPSLAKQKVSKMK